MDLTLRPTVINGVRLEYDFSVYFDGRRVGRIMLAENHVKHVEVWRWNVSPPLPVPQWVNGSADSLEGAKVAFLAAWERFLAGLTPEATEHWRDTDDACRWDGI